MTDGLLVFPPYWTACTGSPHLATALLKGYAVKHDFSVETLDLNKVALDMSGAYLGESRAIASTTDAALATMNEAFFQQEVKLELLAAEHGGMWNAQTGFEFSDRPQRSSVACISAVQRPIPCGTYVFNTLETMVRRLEPSAIAFSICCEQQVQPTLHLCYELRRVGYDGVLLIGGNIVSRLAETLPESGIFDVIDCAMPFADEWAFIELLQSVRKGSDWRNVPGLLWRDGNGEVVTNGLAKRRDLETAVTPNYEDFSVGKYWGTNYLMLVASRGCYYGKCDFCPIPYGWGQSGFAGQRSAESTFADMQMLSARHGVYRFKFADEALSPQFMRKLAELIQRERAPFEWEGYTRFERCWYDEGFVALVAAGGFRKGYFGLEILPSKSRPVLHKGDQPRPETLLRVCSEHGVKVHLFCMFGYPGTGIDDAEATTAFLLEHQELIDTADIFPWGFARHTKPPFVEPILESADDWALEFDYVAQVPNVLKRDEVTTLASEFEELLWDEVPRFLHPIYRLVSPWRGVVSPAFKENVLVGADRDR